MHAVESMVYVGATPWHNLGTRFTGNESLEEWRTAAGLRWEAEARPLSYQATDALQQKVMVPLSSHKVLVRSDLQTVLGVVGRDYKIVQPAKVIEFFRDVVFTSGSRFKMETAGVLFDGRRVWALARTDGEIRIKGQDVVLPYLLFGTSYDGTTSTFASFTSVRVVCNNTLSMSVGADGERAQVRITHAQTYDETAVKQALGLIESAQGAAIAGFEETANRLAEIRVTEAQSFEVLAQLYGPKPDPEKHESWRDIPVGEYTKPQQENIAALFALWQNGPGSAFRSSAGTAWGLVNAVTHFEDFRARSKNEATRVASAQFGAGAKRKAQAVELALALAA